MNSEGCCRSSSSFVLAEVLYAAPLCPGLKTFGRGSADTAFRRSTSVLDGCCCQGVDI